MPSFSTETLQKMQSEYDATYWDHDEFSTFENIRHLTLHMGKLVGKLSAYCEAKEHHGKDSTDEQIKKEVIPDLLSYALQLSNWLSQDIGELYEKRLESNATHFDSENAKKVV